MKLVILCGALEPGQDGVGDYSRRLAEFCRLEGHQVLLVALNDSRVAPGQVVKSADEIRLSSALSWPEKSRLLNDTISRFQPHAISLQFVPFAFHPRGLCGRMIGALAPLTQLCPWEIMFHELWLGLNPSDPLKYRLLGWIQRRQILRLARQISPAVVHTQASVYVEVLRREKISAHLLPLFSNIPIAPPPDEADMENLLTSEGFLTASGWRTGRLIFVLFGSLHPEWNPQKMMQKLSGQNPIFLTIGKLGAKGREIWQRFASDYADQAAFADLGELPPGKISAVLQWADAGVAASPWNLIEKSGSVAAMIEHGLPVIVTRNDFLPSQNCLSDPAWATRLHPVWDPAFSVKKLTRRPTCARLPETGRQFLHDLSNLATA